MYEKFLVDVPKAVEAIESLEKEINHLKEIGEDEIFDQIEDAIFHITYATKARLLLSVENCAEWNSVNYSPSLQSLNPEQQFCSSCVSHLFNISSFFADIIAH